MKTTDMELIEGKSMRSRILVVDDEESIRLSFEKFLSAEGHDISTVEDYKGAISSITGSEFDLVFADIILKDKTGMDLLREFRKKGLNTPVIMITGNPHLDTASEAVRLGAFDYIPKPVRKEQLLHVTNIALKHKALLEEKERYRLNIEAIFRSVKDAIVTLDIGLTVIEVNEAARDICGFTRNVVGREFCSVQTGCNGACLDALRNTIKNEQPVELCHIECRRPGRPKQVVSLKTAPLLDQRGMFSGAVVAIRDETRLYNLERDLKERRRFYNLIGGSDRMQKIYSFVESLSDVPTTVLITGESGTGKELVAEALHFGGNRRNKPLVKVNCSALSENLLESELFGHIRGAFTGAEKDKTGRFQKAHGGTIFLDEIGDISPRIQLRLLRVLQEKEFERVGDSTPIKVDVRIIAATNQDLKEKIDAREFREDLFYRLKVVEINLPPLRRRREDTPLLVDHFISKFNAKFDKGITSVTEDVMNLLMRHPWPGNIRQLENAIEHAFIVSSQSVITVDSLPPEIQDFTETHSNKLGDGVANERQFILQALEKTWWNKTEAARLLGISRRTMYRKMKEYGIQPDKSG